MNRFLTFLFLFLLAHSPVLAQESDSKKTSYRKYVKILMKEEIKKLKNGVLLVRLQTKENAINGLKQMGRGDLASEIEQAQMNYNKEIIAAFKNNFTFCPAWFFFSNYSYNILSNQVKEIVFLNDSLQPDTSIKLNDGNFLTAEFGTVDQDTIKYFDRNYISTGDDGQNMKSSYHSGPDMRLSALKIMSNQLVQLKKPFPYYVRTSKPLSKKKLKRVILRLDRNLFNYYEKNYSSRDPG